MVTAVASRSKEKAEAFRQGNPGLAGASTFGSYDELLADKTIDAIYLPLPAGLHVEWVKKAAAAGKHVLCEKPISLVRRRSAVLASYYIHPGSQSALARKERIRYVSVGLCFCHFDTYGHLSCRVFGWGYPGDPTVPSQRLNCWIECSLFASSDVCMMCAVPDTVTLSLCLTDS